MKRRPGKPKEALAPSRSPLPLRIILTLLICIYTAALFAQPLNLAAADLGRHIENGEQLLRTLEVQRTNTYSYTEPDHPAVNHHWGSGLLFYGIWRLSGFTGLGIFYALLHVAMVGLLYREALRRATLPVATAVTLAAIPLLAFRPEIRPEGLSYALIATFYVMLWGALDQRIPPRWLWLLIPLQIAWTNLHIFFCFGPLLVAVAAFDAWVRGETLWLRRLARLGAGVVLACFVNPFGLEGVLEPFTILEEYGYRVAENESVPELLRSYRLPVLLHFALFSGVAVVVMLLALRHREGRRRLLARSLLLLAFGVLAWRVGRAVALFGLVAIPVLSEALQAALATQAGPRRVLFQRAAGCLALGLGLAAVTLQSSYLSPFKRSLGFGLAPGVERAARFFLENGLEGPIFNDYDIGGYLIFHLYPRERVFVDNRPEAYSVGFFRDVYIPMQQDEELWAKMDRRYGFNVIFFSRQDRTPWARGFLVRRLQDPAWAPVYADGYAVILVKRSPRNRPLIERFEPRRRR